MALLTRRRLLATVGAFALLAAAAALIAPMFGSAHVGLAAATREWWRAAPGAALSPEAFILFRVRLPRVVMGLLAGATLAMVGAVFQALLRNPLATPYTLGISGGGAFGAMIATLLPAWLPAVADWHVGPLSHVQAFACVGTLASMGLIYALARAIGRASTLEILLAGVTLETIFGALTLVARVFADPNSLVTIDRWMMGGLAINGWRDVLAAAPMLAVGLAGLLPMARGLDQLGSGEELAAARGVNVERLQKWAFVLGSVAVAAVVSITGPIGFVGLIVPHGVRRIVGPDHRLLLPCSALAGGAFLVLCDVIARVALAPAELPVGVVTALLGGPFFVYLLTRGRRLGRSWGGAA